MNLILILILSKIYVALAHVLTRWGEWRGLGDPPSPAGQDTAVCPAYGPLCLSEAQTGHAGPCRGASVEGEETLPAELPSGAGHSASAHHFPESLSPLPLPASLLLSLPPVS